MSEEKPPYHIFDRKPFKRNDRCVTCGSTEAMHEGQEKKCQGPAGHRFGTMNLPPGKTCGDCAHIKRCNAMFGHMPADQVCDWFPSRFRAVDRGALIGSIEYVLRESGLPEDILTEAAEKLRNTETHVLIDIYSNRETWQQLLASRAQEPAK